MSSDEPKGDKIVSIFDRRAVDASVEEVEMRAVREEAIKHLEFIIEEFREGRLNGFALVATCEGGGTMHQFTDEVMSVPMEYLGALNRLSHHINLSLDYTHEVDAE